MAAKRPGGLERGGLSLLRRSARTKIRRNSTASNDARTDVSRLRYNVDPDGEYTPVSLVDPGPQPRPSVALPSTVTTTATATAISATATATNINVSSEDSQKTQRNGETQPVKRFVSTLRDSSKPTITTYVEPHLLEQQRRDNEETNRNEGSISSFKVGVPGQLENSASTRILSETSDHQRIETTENFTISYPIPPPVKLTQNLLQQSTSQQPPSGKAPLSPQLPQLSIKQKQVGHTGTLVHGKKPSTWSWLWGKEKGDKSIENTSSGAGVSLPLSAKSNNTPSSQVSSTDINTQAFTSNEVAVKKQSTLSMLFSRNGKSTSSKAQITTVENTQMISTNGQSRQSIISERPKYSNYNRLPIHIERAIYRLSHVKLANPRRPLHEQVLISNMMFWYLGVIQQQQLLQQQQEQQQQQMLLQQAQRQIENNKGFESKEDGKEKSKSKPKKRKSQKKKSQQQKQQQHHHSNPNTNHITPPRQQGSSLSATNQSGSYSNSNEENQIVEPEIDIPLRQHPQKPQIGSQSDTLSTLSIKSAPQITQEDEEDDNVPLAHYQNMPRQAVSVS
ncbi:hypothetical protein BCR41DRAFT_39824 [Lobosporangium transversale]|uniref:Protein Zds1 C-terminal domain-containing protein n=1 Tax=Lobosporangium transversale TaxID=64571 RepID=A0A1Y2GQH5_9FUNG|nr:hypothetical protein BCR41DRAFT_39824 [Lobosporangium transversale]ORZ19156.1 hypothetical protein BCR41DRAFT_39824 [Lobosporangium transversale]|eukprot:XP_021882324.1 hypothetical protein BCR41DRAFT_39824 [Lobosporangium transversale]